MKTSSLTWAAYNDSMSVLYEAGKLWKCLPSHSQIDLTYIDLIITCNHSQPWVVICLTPSPGLFSQTNHRSYHSLCVCVCVCVCVCAVMPVSRIRWYNPEDCTSCDGCVSITPGVLFSDQSLLRWNRMSLYYTERAGQGRPLKLCCILLHSKAFYYYFFTVFWLQYMTISVLDFMLLLAQQWYTEVFGHFSHTKWMKSYFTVLYNKISNIVSRFLKPSFYIFTIKKYIF